MTETQHGAVQDEHAAFDAGIQSRVERALRQIGDDCRVGAARENRDDLQHDPRLRRQARRTRQGGIADGVSRHITVHSEGFCDQERIARCQRKQCLTALPDPLGEFYDGTFGKTLDRHALDAPRRRLTEQRTHWRPCVQFFIPISEQNQSANATNAPSQKADEIQRDGVCPVQILHYDHRGQCGKAQYPQQRLKRPDVIPSWIECFPAGAHNIAQWQQGFWS